MNVREQLMEYVTQFLHKEGVLTDYFYFYMTTEEDLKPRISS